MMKKAFWVAIRKEHQEGRGYDHVKFAPNDFERLFTELTESLDIASMNFTTIYGYQYEVSNAVPTGTVMFHSPNKSHSLRVAL